MSHQINFVDNRINGDEDLVLFRFIGGHLGKSTLLGIIPKIIYRITYYNIYTAYLKSGLKIYVRFKIINIVKILTYHP